MMGVLRWACSTRSYTPSSQDRDSENTHSFTTVLRYVLISINMFILHAEITHTILTLWGLIHHRNDPNPNINSDNLNMWFWQTENKGNNNSSMRKFPLLVFKGSFGHVSKVQARGRVRFFPYDDLVVNFTLPYLLLFLITLLMDYVTRDWQTLTAIRKELW